MDDTQHPERPHKTAFQMLEFLQAIEKLVLQNPEVRKEQSFVLTARHGFVCRETSQATTWKVRKIDQSSQPRPGAPVPFWAQKGGESFGPEIESPSWEAVKISSLCVCISLFVSFWVLMGLLSGIGPEMYFSGHVGMFYI